MKAEAWRKVTEAVNARGVAVHSVDDVKKNWKAVKSDTTQAIRKQNKTGGGPEEKPPIYADLPRLVISCFRRRSGCDDEADSHLNRASM